MDTATRMQSIVAAAERARLHREPPRRTPARPDERTVGDALTTDPQDRKRRANAALLDLVEQTVAKRARRAR